MAFLVVAVMELVMSMTWPASTMADIFPPPRCRKMSGAEPELSAVCSLPSSSSFWIAWMVIFTFGWVFSKSATVLAQKALPSPVVALCQNVIVVAPPLLAPVLPLPQAVSPAALITRAADTARDFLSFMSSFLLVEQQKMRRLP